MEKGYISHTIENLNIQQKELSTSKELPKDAEQIKKEAIAVIKKNVKTLQQAQGALKKNTTVIQTYLKEALTLIQSNKAEGLQCIAETHQHALASEQIVADTLEANKTAQSLFFGYHQQLNKSLQTLEKECARLTVEAQKAKDQADKFKKERYYFLGLGPFGLAGLATATALFATWTDKANKAKKAASRSKAKVRELKEFQDNIRLLQDSFSESIEALSGVKNGFVFVLGSINNMLSSTDGTHQETVVISLHLNAAITEIAVLILDLA